MKSVRMIIAPGLIAQRAFAIIAGTYSDVYDYVERSVQICQNEVLSEHASPP